MESRCCIFPFSLQLSIFAASIRSVAPSALRRILLRLIAYPPKMISPLPNLILLALLHRVVLGAPAARPDPVAAAHPMITARASLEDRTVEERNIISSIEGLGSYLTSVLGTYPSYIASGVPNFFQDFPTGSAVESSLGIGSSDLAASPTQVLNIP